MKILLVITKAEIGGAQTFVLSLAKGLKEKGKEVAVAFGEGNYLPSELEKEGIPFIRLKHLKRSKNPFNIFLLIRELKNLLKKEKFTAIHLNSTNTLPGAIAARLVDKNIKSIFTVHGLSVLDRNYQANIVIKSLFKIYFKFFLQFIDNIVFVSNYNYQAAKKERVIKEGQVIYNGLDLKDPYFLSKDKAREELEKIINHNLKSSFIIGSIGRLAYQKNYQYILNNWLEIKKIKPEAKLIILGEGEKRSEYEKIIKDDNLAKDVFLLGKREEASRLLKGFDFFVLPSIYEGLSISLIETQFAGIPALASNVGGNSEVIGEENCFNLKNKQEFLDKLKRGVIFKDRRNKFYLEQMIKGYIRVYEG